MLEVCATFVDRLPVSDTGQLVAGVGWRLAPTCVLATELPADKSSSFVKCTGTAVKAYMHIVWFTVLTGPCFVYFVPAGAELWLCTLLGQ